MAGETDLGDESSSKDVGPGSVGRVDWSPLARLSGFRPLVSKYGLARYSPMEWRLANDTITGEIPSADALDHESKNVIARVASACDKEQNENTLRLRQRAVDVYAKNTLVTQYCEELREEVEQMAQYKLRLRKALENLGIVEGINEECREIRKNRFTEDLVRDQVEEELFQEKGLCQEIRELYMATLNEFDSQYRTIKGCYQEVHSLWSDQKETLDYEAENIGLKSSSDQISFVHGIAMNQKETSSLPIWESYMTSTLANIKNTIESSRALRRKIHSPVLSDSARDLKKQDEKVLKAFLSRIDEVGNTRQRLEAELDQVLKEIAHAEGLYSALDKLGRQVDFNLKVVQTRLENKRLRPGAENCRDKSHQGLLRELKVISERVTALQVQMTNINEGIVKLYDARKNLERQIHVKKHSLTLDQERCLLFRSKFPNASYLMGF
ncbi:hypothetical protein RUM44_001438 [Polyplax serrata]|uniref:Tektin n=1 Tax=Polyplax serrata TaxID=468196 RepID=A0ABR1AK38_POLSC